MGAVGPARLHQPGRVNEASAKHGETPPRIDVIVMMVDRLGARRLLQLSQHKDSNRVGPGQTRSCRSQGLISQIDHDGKRAIARPWSNRSERDCGVGVMVVWCQFEDGGQHGGCQSLNQSVCFVEIEFCITRLTGMRAGRVVVDCPRTLFVRMRAGAGRRF